MLGVDLSLRASTPTFIIEPFNIPRGMRVIQFHAAVALFFPPKKSIYILSEERSHPVIRVIDVGKLRARNNEQFPVVAGQPCKAAPLEQQGQAACAFRAFPLFIASQNDTWACPGFFCRTQWLPQDNSRYRPCSGCSRRPRQACRFGW